MHIMGIALPDVAPFLIILALFIVGRWILPRTGVST
jgi:hypothetical protein